MQLPAELQSAIDQILEQSSPNALRKAREALSQDYRAGKISPFADEAKRLAYLGARMPATYVAIRKALENVVLSGKVLDLGAGPGTASWVVADLFPDVKEIVLVEQSKEAIELSKQLAQFHPFFQKASWIHQSLREPIPEADGAILAYVLNELDDPLPVVEKCWNGCSTLVLIEPGTPRGFQLIRKARQRLIDLGGHILAPCPHGRLCPIQGNDWCHFSARVERTRLHRLLKEGSLGYEDEKFSYVIAAKHPAAAYSNRVIRHPMKQSGYVRLTLCTERGTIEEKTVSRKDKELYRKARRFEWGSAF